MVAGVLLGAKPPYGRVTAKQLRAALDAVLNEASYRENAQRIGATLRVAGACVRRRRDRGVRGRDIRAESIVMRGREVRKFLVQLTIPRTCGIPFLGEYKRPVQWRG